MAPSDTGSIWSSDQHTRAYDRGDYVAVHIAIGDDVSLPTSVDRDAVEGHLVLMWPGAQVHIGWELAEHIAWQVDCIRQEDAHEAEGDEAVLGGMTVADVVCGAPESVRPEDVPHVYGRLPVKAPIGGYRESLLIGGVEGLAHLP